MRIIELSELFITMRVYPGRSGSQEVRSRGEHRLPRVPEGAGCHLNTGWPGFRNVRVARWTPADQGSGRCRLPPEHWVARVPEGAGCQVDTGRPGFRDVRVARYTPGGQGSERRGLPGGHLGQNPFALGKWTPWTVRTAWTLRKPPAGSKVIG